MSFRAHAAKDMSLDTDQCERLANSIIANITELLLAINTSLPRS